MFSFIAERHTAFLNVRAGTPDATAKPAFTLMAPSGARMRSSNGRTLIQRTGAATLLARPC
jgi:hypothetical protein